MAKVVVIGSGFAGHTAAMYLGSRIGKSHEITVISNNDHFSYLPSWVWVGVGHMKPEKTVFPLKPVYDRLHVNYVHASAKEVHPDDGDQYVIGEMNGSKEQVKLAYDYLVIATGPKLNFAGTPGLGPHDGFSHSICTLPHAVESRDAYLAAIEKMKKGERQRFVIGTGHPGATCQGAAFEYLENIHKDLLKKGLRDKADLLWLSNEVTLGDFGVRGLDVKYRGGDLSSAEFIEAIFRDHGIEWQIQTGVTKVEDGTIYWENYDGEKGTTPFDFAMLIPQFTGQPIKYIGKDGNEVAEKVANKAGFILADGIYGLPYSELENNPEAWPATYQNPNYKNIFSAGIAFAPPGPISKPHQTKNGLSITAAPPRTGMVSGVIGRVVALNIIDLIQKGEMTHKERMSEMVAACIASMGNSLWDGSAAVMIMYPVVPDKKRYASTNGRDLFVSIMEMGLAGAWMKFMLHHTFIWKFKGLPGWKIIPE
jgi:sulfide:quinone oxidoreductase